MYAQTAHQKLAQNESKVGKKCILCALRSPLTDPRNEPPAGQFASSNAQPVLPPWVHPVIRNPLSFIGIKSSVPTYLAAQGPMQLQQKHEKITAVRRRYMASQWKDKL